MKDSAGDIHRIDVYTEFYALPSLDDEPTRWREGMRSHKVAASGHDVKVHADGTLEDFNTGQKLYRVEED